MVKAKQFAASWRPPKSSALKWRHTTKHMKLFHTSEHEFHVPCSMSQVPRSMPRRKERRHKRRRKKKMLVIDLCVLPRLSSFFTFSKFEALFLPMLPATVSRSRRGVLKSNWKIQFQICMKRFAFTPLGAVLILRWKQEYGLRNYPPIFLNVTYSLLPGYPSGWEENGKKNFPAITPFIDIRSKLFS